MKLGLLGSDELLTEQTYIDVDICQGHFILQDLISLFLVDLHSKTNAFSDKIVITRKKAEITNFSMA